MTPERETGAPDTCAKCGRVENIHLLDGKDDGSGDFNLIECIACYGDGWAPCAIEHVQLSVCPDLAPAYLRWLTDANIRGEDEIARLRTALATAERERDEAKSLAEHRALLHEKAGIRANDAEARAASLEGLLTEAGKAVKELADDLSEWVEHHYAKTKVHPSEARRYERDIDPVVRARALLTRIEAREGGEEKGKCV